MKDLLIVGAGITGALTASFLTKALPNLSLTVWDKAHGAGGRMSTHRHPNNPSLHVDMGAQYISKFQYLCSETDKTLQKLKEETCSELISHNVLSPFCGVIDGEKKNSACLVEANYVAPKGMNSVVKHFLMQSNATVHFQQCLKELNVEQGKIRCSTNGGINATFDAVLLTLPVPQILTIQGALIERVDPAIRAQLESVTYSSRYALGLMYNEPPIEVPMNDWSAKYIDHSIIRYASWDVAKRNKSTTDSCGGALLIHTSVPFGKKHLATDKDGVQNLIEAAVNEVLPGLPEPDHSHIIRWRYSQVHTPYPGTPGRVVLCSEPLVMATGDGFIGSNFENCLFAAHTTAQTILQRAGQK